MLNVEKKSFLRQLKQRQAISIIRIMGVELHSGISFGYFQNISIIRKYWRMSNKNLDSLSTDFIYSYEKMQTKTVAFLRRFKLNFMMKLIIVVISVNNHWIAWKFEKRKWKSNIIRFLLECCTNGNKIGLVEFQVRMQPQESIHIHSHEMKNSDHPSHRKFKH